MNIDPTRYSNSTAKKGRPFMIVDLNLKGKQVVVVGGGHEAARKVEALLTQDCEIHVHAGTVSQSIAQRAKEGKLKLTEETVADGGFLKQYDRLILVLAVTDDKDLNRRIVSAAKDLRCYAYAADDPQASDFSHPSVINIQDTVQIAVSTGGKSPLMARRIREQTEAIFNELISDTDIRQIQLQGKLRPHVKTHLPTPDARKRFLLSLLEDETIHALLQKDKLDEAETRAMQILKEKKQSKDH